MGIKTCSILIVDRKDAPLGSLTSCLPDNYKCVLARSAEHAIEQLAERSFDVVITDITMTDSTGREMCAYIHKNYPDSIVVAVSGLGGVQYEIEAMRQGAFEYIEEPFDAAQVCASVEHALRHKTLFGRLTSSGDQTGDANSFLEGTYDVDRIESEPSVPRM